MWRSIRTAFITLLIVAMSPGGLLAQAEEAPVLRDIQLPNPMTPHTWFIIAAVGFFLAWCISYCLQLQKESLAKGPDRETYLRRKEELLNRIADIEAQRDAGTVSAEKYEREFRKAKSQLSEVLLRLGRDRRTSTER